MKSEKKLSLEIVDQIPRDYKKCKSCEKILPLIDFQTDNRLKTGCRSKCKSCYRKKRIATRKVEVERGLVPAYKQCRDCLKTFPVDNFHNSYHETGGYAGICKQCATKRKVVIKLKHFLKNQCAVCDLPKLTASRYCLDHWFKNACRQRLKTNDPFVIQELKNKLERQKYICPYTGRQLIPGVNASLDHIQSVSHHPELRSELSNIEWVDLEVNRAKQTMTRKIFIEFINEIADYAKKNPILLDK